MKSVRFLQSTIKNCSQKLFYNLKFKQFSFSSVETIQSKICKDSQIFQVTLSFDLGKLQV